MPSKKLEKLWMVAVEAKRVTQQAYDDWAKAGGMESPQKDPHMYFNERRRANNADW